MTNKKTKAEARRKPAPIWARFNGRLQKFETVEAMKRFQIANANQTLNGDLIVLDETHPLAPQDPLTPADRDAILEALGSNYDLGDPAGEHDTVDAHEPPADA